MITQLYDIPPIPEIEPKYLFSGSNKKLTEFERKEQEVTNLWESIIKKTGFYALQFISGGSYPQKIMLHRSTKINDGWQLSFIDWDGVPCRDEQYDSSFKTKGGFNENLFHNLMTYSWHGEKIFVEARYN